MANFARVDAALKSGNAFVSRELTKAGEEETFTPGQYDWAAVQGLYFAAAAK